MPTGFLAAGDAYTRRYDKIIEGVKRKVKIVNDTLLYDDLIEEHFFHVWDYLTLCAENCIVINEKSFSFVKTLSILQVLLLLPRVFCHLRKCSHQFPNQLT